MKRIRCPKCDEFISFDEKRIEIGHSLMFRCNNCGKEFSVKFKNKGESEKQDFTYGYVVVVENVFCNKQIFPLQEGDNLFGRRCKGTIVTSPIESGDMSMDRKHCIITVERKGEDVIYKVKDNESLTGTFVENEILQKNERRIISEGTIITIGATTLIFNSGEPE